jgi:Acetyltransferases
MQGVRHSTVNFEHIAKYFVKLLMMCFSSFVILLNSNFMISFQRINSVTDPLFSALYNLYTLSFPENERRSWSGMEFEISFEKRFCPNALMKDTGFVGFFNYWTFEHFCYIEHFAVSPTLRGKGIGTEAMNIFKSQTQLPIVFEVEMPLDPAAVRRIEFYERLGYSVVSHAYAQPPYEDMENFFIPMQLMCDDKHFAETHFEKIKSTLYRNVYHFDTLASNA